MWRLNIDRKAVGQRGGLHACLAWLSLTEIPQLWNVIKGEMSLVGPRPEPPDRVKHYSEWQMQRLRVTPGMTGLAQVHGLREQHASEDKAHYDLQYILHWSPLLDVSLLLQTAWTLVLRLSTPGSRIFNEQQHQQANVGILEVVNADRTHAGAD